MLGTSAANYVWPCLRLPFQDENVLEITCRLL